MPDVLHFPKISAEVLGSSYTICSASVSASINSVITFSITITSSDAVDGGTLTVTAIRQLAGKAQDAIYQQPKEGNVKLTVAGYKGNTLTVEGILTHVNCYANTDGGLSLTLSAMGNDALLNNIDYNLYTDYIDVQTAAKEIFQNAETVKDGNVYCLALPVSQREATGDSVAKRILNLVEIAEAKWKTFSNLDEQPEAIKAAVDILGKYNGAALDDVKRFLKRSDKTTKLFDGVCKVNEATSNQVMNGIHTLLFESGNNFLDAIMAICGQYDLWYVPKLKEKGTGYLENTKYGVEKSNGTLNVHTKSFNYTSGSSWNSRPACIGVVMTSQAYIGAAEGLTNNQTFASRTLVGVYPEKQTKAKGALYVLKAPGWVTLPLLSGIESGTVSDGASKQFKGGKLGKKGRQTSELKTKKEICATKQKPNVDNASNILSYLAQKEYYRILLSPSTATIQGAFSGMPSVEVGDRVNVRMATGGQILNGILSGIDISLTPTASEVTYTVIGATISNVPIK